MIIPSSPLTLVNGFVTILCGVYLLYQILSGPLKSLPFILWTLGFFTYGIEIVLRSVGVLGDLGFILMVNMMAFFLVVGVGLLAEFGLYFFLPPTMLSIISDFLMIYGYQILSVAVSFAAFFLMMSLGVLRLYMKYHEDVVFITIGWVLLMVSNVFAYNPDYIYLVDVFAIVSKVLLAVGLLKIEQILPERVKIKHYMEQLINRNQK